MEWRKLAHWLPISGLVVGLIFMAAAVALGQAQAPAGPEAVPAPLEQDPPGLPGHGHGRWGGGERFREGTPI